ncbi:MAG: hypothetical protein AB7K24_11660 [Gemmataceae bacterium]
MSAARRYLFTLAVLVFSLAYLIRPARAEDPKVNIKKAPAQQFIRLGLDTKKKPETLETAIVRYVPASGEGDLVVDLVGVVHIGDKDYYRTLNRKLAQYDVVLYELVAPEGKKIPMRDPDSVMGMIQEIVGVVLDLHWQVEKIDYTQKNFVHADMSPTEMAAEIKKRGDDGLTLALGVAADMLRQQNLKNLKPPAEGKEPEVDFDPSSLLLDPHGPAKLKRVLAEQLADSAGSGLGETIEKILVADRNKACLKVFQKEMAKGKKKIAIFYGAAHMPDFDKRLRADYGLKVKSEEWLTAWDLTRERDLGDLINKLLK